MRAIAGLRLNLQTRRSQNPAQHFWGKIPHLVFERAT